MYSSNPFPAAAVLKLSLSYLTYAILTIRIKENVMYDPIKTGQAAQDSYLSGLKRKGMQ